MFKKIEIWILYLILIICFLSWIIIGALVRREVRGGDYIPIISEASIAALFLAKIPSNFRLIINRDYSPQLRDGMKLNRISNFQFKESYRNRIENDSAYVLISFFDGNHMKPSLELVQISTQRYVKKLLIEDVSAATRILHPTYSNKTNRIVALMDNKLSGQDNILCLIDGFKDVQILELQNFDLHHSSEFDCDGNIWVCASQNNLSKPPLETSNFYDDVILRLTESGEILFKKSIFEILLRNNLESIAAITNYNPMDVQENMKVDIFHINDIEPVCEDGEYWKKGDVFISLRNRSMILLYRPETDDIIWYRIGPWMNQHDVDVIDSKRISVFGNDVIDINSAQNNYHLLINGHNDIYIYDFENNQISRPYTKVIQKTKISTYTGGLHRILENGDVFIEDQNNFCLYYLSDKDLIWKYSKQNKDGRISMLNWCSYYLPSEIKRLINE